MTLEELIAKLKAATEGSWELDYEISNLVWKRETIYGGGERWIAPYDTTITGLPPVTPFLVLPYTRSLDAALTLVPEGWRVFELSEWNGIEPCGWSCVLRKKNLVTPHEVSAGMPRSNDDRQTKQIASPALALCIAALKARAQMGGELGEQD
jgi:hypothetical protein